MLRPGTHSGPPSPDSACRTALVLGSLEVGGSVQSLAIGHQYRFISANTFVVRSAKSRGSFELICVSYMYTLSYLQITACFTMSRLRSDRDKQDRFLYMGDLLSNHDASDHLPYPLANSGSIHTC